MTKRNLSPEVRSYFQQIGLERGNALKEKYGSAYFSKIAGMRKTFGRKPMQKNSVAELSKRFGISRQRIYQIIQVHKSSYLKEDYEDVGLWREAIVTSFFNNKAANENTNKP